MDLTREDAIRLHRQMWTDMQIELGNCPGFKDRLLFKSRWHKKLFPQENVSSDCFLCEYALQTKGDCDGCPIDWGENGCQKTYFVKDVDWRYSPISEILALPEREDV